MKEKSPKFKNVNEAINYFKNKETQKSFKESARKELNLPYKEAVSKYNKKISNQELKKKLNEQILLNKNYASQLAISRRASTQRNRQINSMGSRAERMELQMLDYSELPLLNHMEKERIRLTIPPNRDIQRIEREVTDSFPD